MVTEQKHVLMQFGIYSRVVCFNNEDLIQAICTVHLVMYLLTSQNPDILPGAIVGI